MQRRAAGRPQDRPDAAMVTYALFFLDFAWDQR
jgi:hypothetical protein